MGYSYCYRNSCGDCYSRGGRNVSNKGKCLENTGRNIEHPILIISMVEDVKGRGGSGYVVKKDNLVLEEWFSSS